MVSAVAVSLVPKSVSMIGIVVRSPSMRRPTWGANGMPPLRTIPDICGKFADTWAVRTPRTTSGRSPGATTTAPSNSRSSTLGSVIAAMTTPVASCASSRSSPLTSVPSQASIMSPTEGAFSEWFLRQRKRRYAVRGKRGQHLVAPTRVGAVGHDREQ